MSNPIDVLERQPLESPPEEIVLGAVRLFRYRAIATVTAIVAIAVIGYAVISAVSASDRQQRLDSVLTSPSAQVVALDAVGTVDGIEFRLTESVWDNGVGFVRVIATETRSDRSEPQVDIEVGEVRVRFAGVNGEAVSSVVNQPSLTIGRSSETRATGSFWVEYLSESPVGDTLSVRFIVVPIPQDFLDNGGELTSDEDGTTGTITFERQTS
jgi:hypothetical protein